MIVRTIAAALALLAGANGARADGEPGCPAEIRGEVWHRARIALPPDAAVTVRLEEQGIADAPAQVLGETHFATGGRQSPFTFAIAPDCARLAKAARPGFTARIEAGGRLLFINDMAHPYDPAAALHRIEVVSAR